MWEVIKQIVESSFANMAYLSQDHNTFAQKKKKKYDTKWFIYPVTVLERWLIQF